MFESAELGRKLSKEDFGKVAPQMRLDLVDIQQRLRHADFPVIVVFTGIDCAGKTESLNLINEWMDPRWIATHAYSAPSQEEDERPEFWRYWRDLPARGQIGLFLSAWYSRPNLDAVHERISMAEFDRCLDRINAFEKMLADDGALILKFCLHLSRKDHKKRLKKLEKDPLEAWRVSEEAWDHWRLHDRFISVAEHQIMRTSPGHAPWVIVEGADDRYRSLTVMKTLHDGLERHLKAREKLKVLGKTAKTNSRAEEKESEKPEAAGTLPTKGSVTGAGTVLFDQPTVLDMLDLSRTLSKEDYGKGLREERARLAGLYRKAKNKGRSMMAVFEGQDAAGKGGAIRRLTAAMSAQDVRVIPVAAPTGAEKAHHYLWRFWRFLPRAGKVIVFDRSWYGRVLVERVEGFTPRESWMHAYSEINDFEQQLAERGIIVVKYWLQISKEEQLRRFKEREKVPYKRWKLTDEDWRNRDKWGEYERAVNDMVERTSTPTAPWTMIEANCKRHARVKVIATFANAIEAALKNH